MQRIIKIFVIALFFIITMTQNTIIAANGAGNETNVFPLDNYSQSLAHWFNPDNPDYTKPLLTPDAQKAHFANLKKHVFSMDGLSPWSEAYVESILQSNSSERNPDDDATLKKQFYQLVVNVNQNLQKFNNTYQTKENLGYGENLLPYSAEWLENIAHSIDIQSLTQTKHFSLENCAIATDNLEGRLLPTTDVYLHDRAIPGQGYPFDMLQETAIWAGTPLYVIQQTKDKGWSLVISPTEIVWVKSQGVAKVSQSFMERWLRMAKKQLVAITKTATAVVDQEGNFRFYAYVGTILPGKLFTDNSGYEVAVPVRGKTGFAFTVESKLTAEQATSVPLLLTPQNIINVMETLLGRPYGWGNLYFYNDCSAEMQNMYAPFGIWLPRNAQSQTSTQFLVNEDISLLSEDNRMQHLAKNGEPFTTLVYIDNHVFAYLGNKPNPHNQKESVPLTMQSIWGLSPNPQLKLPDARYIIGKSVLLPLLSKYPENPTLNSLANKQHFIITHLNKVATNTNMNPQESLKTP